MVGRKKMLYSTETLLTPKNNQTMLKLKTLSYMNQLSFKKKLISLKKLKIFSINTDQES